MSRTVAGARREGRAVHRLVLPGDLHDRVRDGRRPRLRRRRGDGLDRPGEPGPGRAARPVRALTACRCSRSTRRACCSPSGCGRPTRGPSCSAPSEAAERVGAPTVVVHPPFRWQRDYARGFVDGPGADAGRDRRASSRWRTCSRGGRATGRSSAYLPHWDLLELDVPDVTLDLSHTAVSDSDAVRVAGRAGRPALARPPR